MSPVDEPDAHSTGMVWSGADLVVAREALGLSKAALAAALHNPTTDGPWRESRISEAEAGKRPVPDWLPVQVARLEQVRDDLVDQMVGVLGDDPSLVLIVHEQNRTFWAEHPELRGVPAAVQRIAAGLAASEIEQTAGHRPRVMMWHEPQARGTHAIGDVR